MGPVEIREFTASGALGAGAFVVAVTVTDGTTVEIKQGGSGGTTVLTLTAAAGSTLTFTPCAPFAVGADAYVTITGSGVASVMYV